MRNISVPVMFYSKSLYLVCFSAFTSVILLNLSTSAQHFVMPWSVKRLLNGSLGHFLLLNYMVPAVTAHEKPSSKLEIF